jgi:glycosyltransferase involved in cell wall biosynthesis
MKITFLIMNADMTGGSRIIAGHAKRLAARGHQVTVVVNRARGPTWLQRLSRFRTLASTANPPAKRPSHFDGLGLDMRVSKRAGSISDQDVPDADVVIATWWETAEWAQRLSASKGARVYFIQGHEIFSYLPVDRVRATYRAPLHKVTVSAWLRRVIEREYGDHQVDLALNAVDLSVLDAPERGRQPSTTVGFLYNPMPSKRADLVLQAVSLLALEFPDLRVVAFGEYPAPSDCGLGERFAYTRLPTQQQIAEIYRRCDVWVSAAVDEGFVLPALEAMACRTPVVATRSGWPADAIESGSNGYLAQPNDLESLLSGVREVLSLTDFQWRSMSSRAHATAHSHSWEQSTNQFEAALLRGIERGL